MQEEIALVNCETIREVVVKPYELVDWHFFKRTSDIVIYRDFPTIMIFEFPIRMLHIIINGDDKLSYDCMPITEFHERGYFLRVRVQMNPQATMGKVISNEDVIPMSTLSRLRKGVKDPVTLRLFMRMASKIN
jgi:hypothetical protein